jgi:hypothetical protein
MFQLVLEDEETHDLYVFDETLAALVEPQIYLAL